MTTPTWAPSGASEIEDTGEAIVLRLGAEPARPVRFRGQLREAIWPLRLALETLGKLQFTDEDDSGFLLSRPMSPVVTVHADALWFELFRQDGASYARVGIERRCFAESGETIEGSTSVDMDWIWQDLARLRSSHPVHLELGPLSEGASQHPPAPALPAAWLNSCLDLQEAMTLPGTRLEVRPVDLLIAVRHLRQLRTHLPPRALRWEFEPDHEPRMVLEPLEQVIVCKGARHAYTEPRTIRTWGRGRLRWLETLLPHADSAVVFLKGRAMPTFYLVRLGPVSFLLGLSGWSGQRFAGFANLGRRDGRDRLLLERARDYLRQARQCNVDEMAATLEVNWEAARRVLARLCRQGQCLPDLERQTYRARELFAGLPDAEHWPLDPRQERGLSYVTHRQVRVRVREPRPMTRRRRLHSLDGVIEREVTYHDERLEGAVGDQETVEAILNEEGRLIFGRCGCAFFRQHLLNQGPCEHLIALLEGATSGPPRSDAQMAPPAD